MKLLAPKFEARPFREKRIDRDLRFGTGEGRADAKVDSNAELEVPVGRSLDVELVRLLELLRVPRARFAVPVGALIGLVAWSIPLSASESRFGLGPGRRKLAAIMGFGHQVIVPVILTLLVGTLLGLTGAWLGSAGRTLLQPAISRTSASVSVDGGTPSSR